MIPRISPRRIVIPRRVVIKIVKTIIRVLTKPKRSASDGHEGEKKEKKGRTSTLSALRGPRKKKGGTKGDVLCFLGVDDGSLCL
jgi:hypothetical protein